MRYASFPPPEVGRARTVAANKAAEEAAKSAFVPTDPAVLSAKYWTLDKDNKPVEATGAQIQAEVDLGNDLKICQQAKPEAGWVVASSVGFVKAPLAAITTTPSAPVQDAPPPVPVENNPAVVSNDPRRIELEKLPNPALLQEAANKGINVDPAWGREQVINAILAK